MNIGLIKEILVLVSVAIALGTIWAHWIEPLIAKFPRKGGFVKPIDIVIKSDKNKKDAQASEHIANP